MVPGRAQGDGEGGVVPARHRKIPYLGNEQEEGSMTVASSISILASARKSSDVGGEEEEGSMPPRRILPMVSLITSYSIRDCSAYSS